jgi:ATP-dependent RNA helicase DDX49/DBP8
MELESSALPASTSSSFKELGIGRWLIRQLNELNLQSPTPIQANCIPKILEGCDVLGCAKTGTGKTLAFALPILQKVSLVLIGCVCGV